MALNSVDDYIARLGAGFGAQYPFQFEQIATTANFVNVYSLSMQKVGIITMPSLPSGVTNYIPTRVSAFSQQGSNWALLFAWLIDLGSINISGASGTFTDGSAMPTVTEAGVSRVMDSAMIAVVDTALNATPGTLTVTYTDQDGNSQTTAAHTMVASSIAGSASPMRLVSPDTGVRDITAAARAAGTTPTGVVRFYGVIPITTISPFQSSTVYCENLVGPSGFNPVRQGGSALLGIFALNNTAAKTVIGCVDFLGDD